MKKTQSKVQVQAQSPVSPAQTARKRKPKPQFSEDISKDEVAALPRAVYPGRIVVVDSYEGMYEAVQVLSKAKLIGFDTETKPSFQAGRSNPVALLQLSTPEVCYLFRLRHIELPEPLVELLERTDILKIGLGVAEDLRGLRRYSKFTAGGFVELQRLAPGYGIRALSLQRIYAIVCGGCISKSQQMSNWEATSLSAAQKAYASLDAWACTEIYEALRRTANPDPIEFARHY